MSREGRAVPTMVACQFSQGLAFSNGQWIYIETLLTGTTTQYDHNLHLTNLIGRN